MIAFFFFILALIIYLGYLGLKIRSMERSLNGIHNMMWQWHMKNSDLFTSKEAEETIREVGSKRIDQMFADDRNDFIIVIAIFVLLGFSYYAFFNPEFNPF